jgi:hypothetical protein
LFSSTLSEKGKLFKTNKLHWVKSVNRNINKFFVLNCKWIYKKVDIVDDRKALLLINFDFHQCRRGTVYYIVFCIVIHSSYLTTQLCNNIKFYIITQYTPLTSPGTNTFCMVSYSTFLNILGKGGHLIVSWTNQFVYVSYKYIFVYCLM